MSEEIGFFFLLLSNGVLYGLMYALIALGFVLVYKATDAVNFAQGEFLMVGAYTMFYVCVVVLRLRLEILNAKIRNARRARAAEPAAAVQRA